MSCSSFFFLYLLKLSNDNWWLDYDNWWVNIPVFEQNHYSFTFSAFLLIFYIGVGSKILIEFKQVLLSSVLFIVPNIIIEFVSMFLLWVLLMFLFVLMFVLLEFFAEFLLMMVEETDWLKWIFVKETIDWHKLFMHITFLFLPLWPNQENIIKHQLRLNTHHRYPNKRIL